MSERYAEPYSDPRWWWINDFSPECFECANFHGMVKGKPRCEAFPEGVPKDIILSKSPKHRMPYPGDKGIIFERAED